MSDLSNTEVHAVPPSRFIGEWRALCGLLSPRFYRAPVPVGGGPWGYGDVTCAVCLTHINGAREALKDYARSREATPSYQSIPSMPGFSVRVWPLPGEDTTAKATPIDVQPGRKDDAGKPRPSLIPWKALMRVVGVLEHGANKYGIDNWRKVPEPRRRYFDAAQRHLIAWWNGEHEDPVSGMSHLAHAICCALFLLALET